MSGPDEGGPPAVVVDRDGVSTVPLATASDADWWARGGTYTLVLSTPDASVDVGALGSVPLPAAAHTYTGSALGGGGFGRIDRHRRVVAGDHGVRHWHVDYLTGRPATGLAAVVLSPGRDVECAVATRLRDRDGVEVVTGFGASDCDCAAHLVGFDSTDGAHPAVRRAHVDAEADTRG